ncbi:Plasmodium exported protein, unknown function [Plasmodium gallinaceum]|uniref:Uncharacterized protein n=1 Tax=Plasmodium gallinaceum TaxID=5849 RepID=A0A1J1H015_PLAGA|nr:Plasmodium exported protein, unknown function [Plasmodium gallinaceum]CRG98214.1 Plasmodium exported protein, unknown function [Plasmodium gallinaceum]
MLNTTLHPIIKKSINYENFFLGINNINVNHCNKYYFSKKEEKCKRIYYANNTINIFVLLFLLSLLYFFLQSTFKLQGQVICILGLNRNYPRKLIEREYFYRKKNNFNELKRRISEEEIYDMWCRYMNYMEEEDCNDIYIKIEEEWKNITEEYKIEKKWSKKILKVWYTELSRELLYKYLQEYRELENKQNDTYTLGDHIEFLNEKLNQWRNDRYIIMDKWKTFREEATHIWNEYILETSEKEEKGNNEKVIESLKKRISISEKQEIKNDTKNCKSSVIT